ncbi:MAG TPA: hypothetical protein VIU40_01665, partial [Geobacteraceae bacterium]
LPETPEGYPQRHQWVATAFNHRPATLRHGARPEQTLFLKAKSEQFQSGVEVGPAGASKIGVPPE